MKKLTQRKTWLLEAIKVLNAFQTHFVIYILVNGGMWMVWLLIAGMDIYSWPAYITVIWSCILFLHSAFAEKIFHSGDKKSD